MLAYISPVRSTRPDDKTLRRRKLMVWQVAESLHEREAAHVAWGHLGITQRLKLGSYILDLVRRNRGNDGGRYLTREIP
jgi:hypothetical protein